MRTVRKKKDILQRSYKCVDIFKEGVQRIKAIASDRIGTSEGDGEHWGITSAN